MQESSINEGSRQNVGHNHNRHGGNHPPRPGPPACGRNIFPNERNQNVQDPMRWSSSFLNRTQAAYNEGHFKSLGGGYPFCKQDVEEAEGIGGILWYQ